MSTDCIENEDPLAVSWLNPLEERRSLMEAFFGRAFLGYGKIAQLPQEIMEIAKRKDRERYLPSYIKNF